MFAAQVYYTVIVSWKSFCNITQNTFVFTYFSFILDIRPTLVNFKTDTNSVLQMQEKMGSLKLHPFMFVYLLMPVKELKAFPLWRVILCNQRFMWGSYPKLLFSDRTTNFDGITWPRKFCCSDCNSETSKYACFLMYCYFNF